MKWFKILYMDAVTPKVFECQANDEKDAVFQFTAQHPNEKVEDVQEFLPPIKPVFVRVHHGFITVNLIPEVADKLGLKEGGRLQTFEEFSYVVNTQNEFIVQEWFERTGNERPTDKMEAFNFMISNYSN